MTAGGDRPRPAAASAIALLTAAVMLTAAGCTSESAAPSGLIAGAPAPHLGQAVAGVPDTDQQAIRSTIDRLNGSAGTVSDQQAVLAAVVDPALAAALQQCPPVTVTVRFEPIYQGLRPAPGWTPASGTLSGTVYALPSLIRIYTGDRITGTDLTTLHLGVTGGEAFVTPLCVS